MSNQLKSAAIAFLRNNRSAPAKACFDKMAAMDRPMRRAIRRGLELISEGHGYHAKALEIMSLLALAETDRADAGR